MDDFESNEEIEGALDLEESLEGPLDDPKPAFNIMDLMNNPAVAKMLDSGKELFKKKEVNPDICEISIKAPSEVVLKLFGINEQNEN